MKRAPNSEPRRGLSPGLANAYVAEQARRKPLAPKLGTFEPPSRIKRKGRKAKR